MASPARGLYETLVTAALEAELRDDASGLVAVRADLRAAEAADRIALHVARLVERALSVVPEKDRVAHGVALARALVDRIGAMVARSGVDGEAPVASETLLTAMVDRRPDGSEELIASPLIPLLDTVLLTNAPGEPNVGSQLRAEIESADRIDIVMAFIRWSGIRAHLDALAAHCDAGRPLRVLTTTYTGSTEARALDELRKRGAEVRVSYDTSTTRLHAKAWLFHRKSGFSTAYIGSSNLTHSALVDGLEWNVRVAGARNPLVLERVAAVFESYWQGGDFERYDRATFEERVGASAPTGPTLILSPVELRLEPFQERLLEQIALARSRSLHQNLLVSATGTGKTVMAAVDYARLRSRLSRARLLFVAHREEILAQSLATFRHALRDAAFGELWVGGQRPRRFEHVFASIQSLSASGLAHLAPDHFDVVIVDEFHHAAAPSYAALLDHVQPVELLGLTATPERADGLPVLRWFGDRIACELRLWDAIDQHRLAPFAYFGVHDGLDLRDVPWRRGRGYDAEGLTNLITASDLWARRVIDEVVRRVDDVSRMRALGFCVSVEHARYMARVFQESGIGAVAIWADTPEAERRQALADLAARRVRVVFSVDLFNEGVDVPSVDTLLLLRPTDSATLFLQQLGRGLRKSADKSLCTVLDFVGQHRKEFRFDRRLRALLGGSRRALADHVSAGFPFLPAGCHMELDRVARDIVLANLKQSLPSQWSAKVEELRALAAGGTPVSLRRYLDETGLDPDDVYAGAKSFSDLCGDAGLAVRPSGPSESELRRAIGRLLHVDDMDRLTRMQEFLASEAPPDVASLSVRDARLLRMLVASLVGRGVVSKDAGLAEACALVWHHPQVRDELLQLFDVLVTRIEHESLALDALPDVPLRVFARYTRIEILAALGVGDGAKVASWQTGVLEVKEAATDLLAFTLDKTRGQFSPTTRYRDYAISRELIHWESQSITRADSETGRRYRDHAARGRHILLFARRSTDDRAFWFLGPATYVSHEGERPMAVTWRLHHPLPGDLFAAFAAAVA